MTIPNLNSLDECHFNLEGICDQTNEPCNSCYIIYTQKEQEGENDE
jgi:hypothetical protein